MIRKDYHGWLVEDAVRDVEMEIGRARMGESTAAEFVTGNGAIKKAVIRILDDYGLTGRDQMGNSGVVVADLF